MCIFAVLGNLNGSTRTQSSLTHYLIRRLINLLSASNGGCQPRGKYEKGAGYLSRLLPSRERICRKEKKQLPVNPLIIEPLQSPPQSLLDRSRPLLGQPTVDPATRCSQCSVPLSFQPPRPTGGEERFRRLRPLGTQGLRRRIQVVSKEKVIGKKTQGSAQHILIGIPVAAGTSVLETALKQVKDMPQTRVERLQHRPRTAP